MKPIVLAIDLQSCNCDPKVAFPNNQYMQQQYAHLDKFAVDADNFHKNLPEDIKTFFAVQETEEDANSIRILTEAEKKLYRVVPKKHDQILVKNQYSVLEEHGYLFDELKEKKNDVIILIGVWSGKCILENAEDLLSKKFKVILPMDLIKNPENRQSFDSFAHLAHNKNLVFTNSQCALQDAYHLMGQAPKPERIFQYGLREALIASTYG